MSEASNPKISVALPNVDPKVCSSIIILCIYMILKHASTNQSSKEDEEEEEELRPHETASKITGYRFVR